MPNSHFDVKLISRSQGQSAVASAAYRAGQILRDERLAKSFDYTNKGDVRFTEIMLPAQAPTWATDRERLWNEVEASEKRVNSQLARSVTAALPRELDLPEQIAIVRRFVAENFTSQGMIADVAIHEITASDGLPNPHVHIMLTLRNVDRSGFTTKNRSWNDQSLVTAWRKSWETITNEALEAAGVEDRVSLESYKAQGIDREPEFHLGYEAAAMEAEGIQTEPGDRLREIRHRNDVRDVVGDVLSEAESWQQATRPAAFDTVEETALAPAARHEQTLLAWFGETTRSTIAAANEVVIRVNQWWERTVEATREIYDRVAASWVERSGPEYPPGMEPQRGPER